MDTSKIKVGITQGDINGIGYEVIIKALMDPTINDLCVPVVYGSPKVAAYHRKAEEKAVNGAEPFPAKVFPQQRRSHGDIRTPAYAEEDKKEHKRP